MSTDRHLSLDDVKDCVRDIFGRNKDFCSYDVDYVFDPGSDDGDIITDVNHPVGSLGYTPIEVSVGTLSLVKNMDERGQVRDEDAVWVMMQAFHESAHLWSYCVGYMQWGKYVPSDTKYMARDVAISRCIPEYKDLIYAMNASELFADRYAVEQIKPFIQRRAESKAQFAGIQVDDIVCEKAKFRHGEVWPNIERCETCEDLAQAYTRVLTSAPYCKKFNYKYLCECEEKSPALRKLLADERTVSEIISAANGVDESNVLCRYVGRTNPGCLRGLLCIRDDYCGGILGVGEKVVEKIIRVVPQPFVELDHSGASQAEQTGKGTRELPNAPAGGKQDGKDDTEYGE